MRRRSIFSACWKRRSMKVMARTAALRSKYQPLSKESNIEKTNLDAFIHAVGSEIEQAQVRLIVAANAQMLFHYWKVGY